MASFSSSLLASLPPPLLTRERSNFANTVARNHDTFTHTKIGAGVFNSCLFDVKSSKNCLFSWWSKWNIAWNGDAFIRTNCSQLFIRNFTQVATQTKQARVYWQCIVCSSRVFWGKKRKCSAMCTFHNHDAAFVLLVQMDNKERPQSLQRCHHVELVSSIHYFGWPSHLQLYFDSLTARVHQSTDRNDISEPSVNALQLSAIAERIAFN